MSHIVKRCIQLSHIFRQSLGRERHPPPLSNNKPQTQKSRPDGRLNLKANSVMRFTYAPSALMRFERREILRDALFLCTMPFCAARVISG